MNQDCRDFHDCDDAGILLGGDLTWVVMGRYCYVSFGYEWLDCVLRVQSVTWVGMLISPSAPVSSTGTGFDSSPIKGEGVLLVGAVLLLPCPVDSRLRGNDGDEMLE